MLYMDIETVHCILCADARTWFSKFKRISANGKFTEKVHNINESKGTDINRAFKHMIFPSTSDFYPIEYICNPLSENYSRTICFVSRGEREWSNWKENPRKSSLWGKICCQIKVCRFYIMTFRFFKNCNAIALAEQNLFLGLGHFCILFQYINHIS